MIQARTLVALAAATALATGAFAQTTMPAARGDVKAAVQAGKTAEGEIKDGSASAPTGMSDKSRGDVKADAKAAVKTGSTAEGEKGGTSYSGPGTRTGSTASRSKVKSEARAAMKNGTTAEGEKGGPAYDSRAKGAKPMN